MFISDPLCCNGLVFDNGRPALGNKLLGRYVGPSAPTFRVCGDIAGMGNIGVIRPPVSNIEFDKLVSTSYCFDADDFLDLDDRLLDVDFDGCDGCDDCLFDDDDLLRESSAGRDWLLDLRAVF